MSVPIPERTRIAVRERSCGRCERCQSYRAVHMHHLTYKCGPNAKPEDIQHICVMCHMDLHPDKAPGIREFEMNRDGGYTAEEYWEERQEKEQREGQRKEELEYREKQREEEMWKRRQDEQMERERWETPETAWNLGKYEASGYCLEDVEREERERIKQA